MIEINGREGNMFVEDLLSQRVALIFWQTVTGCLLQIILGEQVSYFFLSSFHHLALQLDFSELLEGGNFSKENFQGYWGQKCCSLLFRGEHCSIAHTLMCVELDVLCKSNGT